jgi:hypothetical protein
MRNFNWAVSSTHNNSTTISTRFVRFCDSQDGILTRMLTPKKLHKTFASFRVVCVFRGAMLEP